MNAGHANEPPAPGAVRPFEFPAVDRQRLDASDNTLEVLCARHGVLPLVTAYLVLDAGAAAEPAGLEGVGRLTAHALETGTESRDAKALSWDLERLGVELVATNGWDGAHFAMTVPRDRVEPAVALLAEIVRRPAFPAEQVTRLRDEQLATILQRRKEPGALADDMAARVIFGSDVPYARPVIGVEDSVRTLDRDAVGDYYRDRYRPGGGALVLTGDIDSEQVRDLVARTFGGWDAGAPAPPDFEVRPHVETTTVFVVDRPGAVQSEIRIGHVGVERHHPDYFPLRVFNTILGGSFTSRLNMNLREKHGFTYGARSRFSFRKRPGPFIVEAAVETDATARAVEEAFKEIHAIRDNGVTARELDAARDYLRGVLPLKLQTAEQLAGRIAEIVIFDLPDGYFHDYRDNIAAVDADDVLRVARQHVRPHHLAVALVGDADQIAGPVSELGLGDVHVHNAT